MSPNWKKKRRNFVLFYSLGFRFGDGAKDEHFWADVIHPFNLFWEYVTAKLISPPIEPLIWTGMNQFKMNFKLINFNLNIDFVSIK